MSTNRREAELPFPTEVIYEGHVQLTVPRLVLYAKGPAEFIPSKAPVFYNPLMAFNRDVAVLALTVYQKRKRRTLSLCDPFTGCGVRGIRYAVEVEGIQSVVLNDLNPLATELTQVNVQANALSDTVSLVNADAHALLSQYAAPRRRFDVIDVDPYGSPAPFLDAVVRAIRNDGLIALTATDMAPLCGVQRQVCLRKYYGMPLRTEYCHEIAVRLVLHALVYSAVRHNLGITTLFSHSSDHYVRIYAQITRGAKAVTESLEHIGYIIHCFNCLHRKVAFGPSVFMTHQCAICGERMQVAGPLWLGRLFEERFCREMAVEAEQVALSAKHRARKLVNLVAREGNHPTYFVLDKVSKKLGLTTPPQRKVVERLVQAGYEVTPTHFNPRGIKSNALIDSVNRAVEDAVHSR